MQHYKLGTDPLYNNRLTGQVTWPTVPPELHPGCYSMMRLQLSLPPLDGTANL